ncbi:RING-H2 finger protein ATL58-like [Magnolia sinica]|uniref:RING-H2 finger protein ATL58-like n=1 Tax=Magnolia sinica TaxID=86752 RepID=UPI002659F55F|nr:RING-H2 finger protein ATL58-like [Magnolia sinica]
MSYSSDPPACCSTASPELKLYQAFIFSVPIFFTFILLLLFYLFYLRRQRVDWSSLRMRSSYQGRGLTSRPSNSGLKKELREMLPIVVFKESFLIRETQCSVCLGDYKANDKLQQIPACGHTFHMDCIDLWLANNTTCPLCRLSLLPATKAASDPPSDIPVAQTIQIQPDEPSSESSADGVVQRAEAEECLSNEVSSVVIDVETHVQC